MLKHLLFQSDSQHWSCTKICGSPKDDFVSAILCGEGERNELSLLCNYSREREREREREHNYITYSLQFINCKLGCEARLRTGQSGTRCLNQCVRSSLNNRASNYKVVKRNL